MDELDKFTARLGFPGLLIIAAILCVAIGILDCGSRGALAAMMAGVVACLMVCVPIRMLPIAAIFASLIGVIGWLFAKSDALELRSVARARDTEIGLNPVSARWEYWLDSWRAIEAFPWFGSGLGTFEVAYLPFQQSELGHISSNTHNIFLQPCAEAGAFGLVWAVVVVIAIGWTACSLARSHDVIDRVLLVALCFVFAATIVSQSTNFAIMHLPQATSVTLLVSLITRRE